MEFTKLKEYKEGIELNNERERESQKKLEDFQSELTEVKIKYEEEIAKGVRSGKADDAKIDSLDKEIETLSKSIRRTEAEQKVLHEHLKPPVTKDEIVEDWNKDFRPAYFKKYIKPSLDEVREAKLNYVDKVSAYHEILQDYEDKRAEVYEKIGNQTSFGNSHRYKVKELSLNQQKEVAYYYLSDNEMESMLKGIKPDIDKGNEYTGGIAEYE